MKANERLAYFAGIIDGEGSIGIYSHNKATGYYYPKLAVVMNNKELIDSLHEFFEMGTVVRDQGGRNYPMWRWRVTGGKQLAKVLTGVLPFLIDKHAQAKLILDFQILVGSRGHTKPLTEEERAIRYAYYWKLREEKLYKWGDYLDRMAEVKERDESREAESA